MVVVSHAGEELFKVGGRWDKHLRKYVGDCPPRVVGLQESQLEVARGFAAWLDACRRRDSKRPRLIMAGGNRGSGKTWFLAGVGLVAVALEWPKCWQLAVNITAKQRRECLEAIAAVAPEGWIEADTADFRDMRTEFVTGATVQWLSGQNPRAIRQAGLPIRHVFINEGQDQPESVFINGISAIRNTGGFVSVATNPPQQERGDWVAALWAGIEAEEINGQRYLLDNRLNRAIDQDSLPDIAAMIRTVNRDAAEADSDGIFHLSGPIAYPAFSPLSREKGGHVGEPPHLGWMDVTREVTAVATEGDAGFDYVCGIDFQRQPGLIGSVAKVYRDERQMLVLHVIDVIGVRGVEPDFSQALMAAGYAPAHGTSAPPVLLIGDATGARQNAEHRWGQPPSFTAMKADGWKIIPPMKHWKRGTPWNPMVKDSRAQMHSLFENHQILVSKRCAEPAEGFPSLLESFRRAKVGPRGGLIEKGHFQHGCDAVRYMAWKLLPRPQPPRISGMDTATFDQLRKIKVLTSG